MTRIAALAIALLAAVTAAAQAPQWPPPSGVEMRMRELQGVLAGRDTTAAQREAARDELSNLLKSPAGQARGRTADEKPARPRAAIEPSRGIVKPAENPLAVQPPVANLEVTDPPRPPIIPQSGAVTTSPSGRFAVNPRSGAILHEIPGGYVDPRTGQVTPR